MARTTRFIPQALRRLSILLMASACLIACKKPSPPSEKEAVSETSKQLVEKEPEPRFLKVTGAKTSWKMEVPELDDEAFAKMLSMYKSFAAFPDKSPMVRKRVEPRSPPENVSITQVESAVERLQEHAYFESNGLLRLFTDVFIIPNFRHSEFTLTLTSLLDEEQKEHLSEVSQTDKSRSPVWANNYGAEQGPSYMGIDGKLTAVTARLKLKIPTKFAHYELDCKAGSVTGPTQKGIHVSGVRCLGGTVQVDVVGTPQETTLDIFNKEGDRLYRRSHQASGLFQDGSELSAYKKWADVPKTFAGYRLRSTAEGEAARAVLHVPIAFAEGEIDLKFKSLKTLPKLRFEVDEGDPTYGKVSKKVLDALTVELRGSTALLTTDKTELVVPLPTLANSAYAEVRLSDVVALTSRGKSIKLGSISLTIRDNLLAGNTLYKIEEPLRSIEGKMKIRYPASARLVEIKSPGDQGAATFEGAKLKTVDKLLVPDTLNHDPTTWLRPLRAYDAQGRALARARSSGPNGLFPFLGPIASLKVLVVDSWYEAEREFHSKPSEPDSEVSSDDDKESPGGAPTPGTTTGTTAAGSDTTFIDKATTKGDAKNSVSAYITASKGHENLPKNGNAKVWSIKSKILACYDKAVAGESKKRSLSQLVIWVNIGAKGIILNSGIRVDTSPPGVAPCVLPLVRSLRFSAPAQGKMEGLVMSQFNLVLPSPKKK